MKILFLFLMVLLLVSCEGPYSTLATAGKSAQTIADLFWWMLSGGIIIWLIFVTILFYALLRPRKHDTRLTAIFIIGGGVVFPILILSILLYFSLVPLPELLRPAPQGSLRIEVSGIQWWWRINYLQQDGFRVELANEIRLPVNEPVQLYLKSEDVIHSFWIPSLGGKMDMIPGRKNMLTLFPSKIGTFGGVCAEYCGASHSLMKLKVVVMEKDKFEQWLIDQALPAKNNNSELAVKGKKLFIANGCTACHSVRGVETYGVIGPDLTHVGSRLSLGAGTLSNTHKSFNRWIANVDKLKPNVKMPAFDMLPAEEREAIAYWLEGLK